MARHGVVCRQRAELSFWQSSLWEVRVEWGQNNGEECDPRKGCKMMCETTWGTQCAEIRKPLHGLQSRLSLIFILQTTLLISPEGCPFSPHTPIPIWNHKVQERLGVGTQTYLLPRHFTHLCAKQSGLKHSDYSFPTSSVCTNQI